MNDKEIRIKYQRDNENDLRSKEIITNVEEEENK